MTEIEQTEQTPLEQLEAYSGKPRAKVILATVRGLIRDEQRLTTAAVDAACFTLPLWTETDDMELALAQGVVAAEADIHVAQLEAEAANVVEETMGGTVEATTPIQPQTIDRDAVLAAMNESIKLREAARTALNVATRKRQELRGKLADLLQEWSTGLPKVTHEMAARAVAETTRAVRAQNRHLGGRPGPSAYDRERWWGLHGDTTGTAFLKKRMVRGGKRFTRGEVMFADGRIGRPKLPSER